MSERRTNTLFADNHGPPDLCYLETDPFPIFDILDSFVFYNFRHPRIFLQLAAAWSVQEAALSVIGCKSHRVAFPETEKTATVCKVGNHIAASRTFIGEPSHLDAYFAKSKSESFRKRVGR